MKSRYLLLNNLAGRGYESPLSPRLVNPLRYPRYEEGPARLGWLLDLSATTVPNEDGKERSGLDLYFLQQVSLSGLAFVISEDDE
jgi:hypothetical protein